MTPRCSIDELLRSNSSHTHIRKRVLAVRGWGVATYSSNTHVVEPYCAASWISARKKCASTRSRPACSDATMAAFDFTFFTVRSAIAAAKSLSEDPAFCGSARIRFNQRCIQTNEFEPRSSHAVIRAVLCYAACCEPRPRSQAFPFLEIGTHNRFDTGRLVYKHMLHHLCDDVVQW